MGYKLSEADGRDNEPASFPLSFCCAVDCLGLMGSELKNHRILNIILPVRNQEHNVVVAVQHAFQLITFGRADTDSDRKMYLSSVFISINT